MNQSNIRNFAIIAHVDHGKSTLSDRLLEITGTISSARLEKQEQFLDQNPISRERGITIKLAPVRMIYKFQISNIKSQMSNDGTLENNLELEIRNSKLEIEGEYLLNLIDTPGHVDFSYEVSRTLAACEGAILLVDATKGVQAQTVAHLREARKQNLTIIPAINKIDLASAELEKALKQMAVLGFEEKDIHLISARTGQGVEELLKAVVTQIPSPRGDESGVLRALVFDAVYDEHRGVIAFVRMVDGSVVVNSGLSLVQNNTKTQALEVGIFTPALVSTKELHTGEIGYIVTGVKDIRQVRVGDTITSTLGQSNARVEALPGYLTPKPMVFFGVYPRSSDELVPLKQALEKLSLIDASILFQEEYSAFLGSGFRVGFLGLLHADIFKQRLFREFALEPLFTLPHVEYEQQSDGTLLEPFMHLTIHVPQDYMGGVMQVCQKKRGLYLDLEYQDTNILLTYDMPYASFLKGLSSDLKSVSAGFASIDYELTGYRPADVVPLEVRVNDIVVDVLSELVYRDEAEYVSRERAKKLKDSLPRAQVKQVIQCIVGGKILAREEISPYRKDVLAKMSGGDRTRKDKLLEAQKKGKKKMSSVSKIDIPQEALFSLVSSD